MPNKTNYAKKRHHRTMGFSAHPEKVAILKELFYKTCFVATHEFKQYEQEVIDLAEEKGVPLKLGKRKIMSQAELLLILINQFYKENDIENKWVKYKGRMPNDL